MNLHLSFNDDRTKMKCVLKGDGLYWVDEFESNSTYQLYNDLMELIKWEKPTMLIEESLLAFNYDLFVFLHNNGITTHLFKSEHYKIIIND